MKILLVITEGDVGGAQRHVLDLGRELARRGHDIFIAHGGAYNYLEQEAMAGEPSLTVVRLKRLLRPIKPLQDFLAIFELIKVIKKINPDLVHAHSSKAGIVASLAGWLAGKPVIYTAHGFVFREKISWVARLFYRWAERLASLLRRRVIAVSKSDADSAIAKKILSASKITVIHNGINENLRANFLERNSARQQLSALTKADLNNQHVVLAIANLYPAKNIPLLIQAFEYVVRRDARARLVIIGDGQERPVCEKIIKDNPILQDKVWLVGQQPSAYKFLTGADLLVLSSSKEGLPYTILEAQLAGVPVVATRVGGIPEMGEEPGLTLVVPHSAELLSEAINKVLQRGACERCTIKKEFTLQGMVDAVEAVYRQVLK